MKYLVVGGTSEAGKAAMEAIREFDAQAHIISTTSKEVDVPGADRTIFKIDFTQSIAADSLLQALENESPIEGIFFTPAYGPLGYPVSDTNKEHIDDAMGFCYEPLVKLSRTIKPRFTAGFSSFYWLEHISVAYGSMGAAKYALEKLAVNEPENFKIIRAGTFFSRSTRGICLLINREIKKTTHPLLLDLTKRWKASGLKFQEYFFKYAHSVEHETYDNRFDSEHRPTEAKDLKIAIHQVLKGESEPIVNVIGDWSWTENSLPELPADFAVVTANV